MAKNIVVFSDGTGQDGGVRPEQRMSNVYKLYRACRVAPTTAINPSEQVAFYDPGLGTDTTATGWTSVVRSFQKLLASVTGRGITINIVDCYEFIIDHYEPGDRVFLFGFSRGAYTVRSVANLLMLCGVPTSVAGNPLPRFRKATRDIAKEAVYTVLEHGAGHPREMYEQERFELARRFCERYESQHESGEERRSNVAPHFIGVFDTVAALGVKGPLRLFYQALLTLIGIIGGGIVALIPAIVVGLISATWSSFFWALCVGAAVGLVVVWFIQRREIKKVIHDYPTKGERRKHFAEWKGEHFDRLLSCHVKYGRSANAIDESREDFARLPWGPTAQAPDEVDGHIWLKQVWFAGNHSDIGGSYPETESRLSDITLAWMIEEAVDVPAPLKIGPIFVNGAKLPNTGDEGEPLRLFPSVDGVQHCEVVGMKDAIEAKTPKWLQGLTGSWGYSVKPRTIHDNASLHKTVLERFALPQVRQCSSTGAYRPEVLREHRKCKAFYPPLCED